jgi:hypothetical protein
MPQYLLETGHGVALVDLDALDPQPRTDATVRPIQRNDSASGLIHEIGLYIVLQYSTLNVTKYQSLLTQMGLSATVTANQVTIYVPNQIYTWARYNAIVRLPEQGVDVRRNYFLKDVNFVFSRLSAL